MVRVQLLEMRWTGFEWKQIRKLQESTRRNVFYQCQESHQRISKSQKKGGGEGRCDKNVECRRRGASTSCAIRGTALWCFVAYGCWTLRPTPGAKDEEASSIATPGPLDRLNN